MKVIRVAGPWKRKDKQGRLLLSGDLSEISRVVVTKNTSKIRDKDPDYFLCIGPKGKKVRQER